MVQFYRRQVITGLQSSADMADDPPAYAQFLRTEQPMTNFKGVKVCTHGNN
jgi:hypothetical protein